MFIWRTKRRENMANYSNGSLCNVFVNSIRHHHESKKRLCDDIDNDPETSYKCGKTAGYYVIVVILFYGASVVFLLASRIKRKRKKISEDRQIHKYLKEFQVVKESSSRDNYRNLKRSMVAKLNTMGMLPDSHGGESAIYRCLSTTLIPMTAVAISGSTDQIILPKRTRIKHNQSHLFPINEYEEYTIRSKNKKYTNKSVIGRRQLRLMQDGGSKGDSTNLEQNLSRYQHQPVLPRIHVNNFSRMYSQDEARRKDGSQDVRMGITRSASSQDYVQVASVKVLSRADDLSPVIVQQTVPLTPRKMKKEDLNNTDQKQHISTV